VDRNAWVTGDFDSFLFGHDLLHDFLVGEYLVFLGSEVGVVGAWIWYLFVSD
jgi:hypothetical protein